MSSPIISSHVTPPHPAGHRAVEMPLASSLQMERGPQTLPGAHPQAWPGQTLGVWGQHGEGGSTGGCGGAGRHPRGHTSCHQRQLDPVLSNQVPGQDPRQLLFRDIQSPFKVGQLHRQPNFPSVPVFKNSSPGPQRSRRQRRGPGRCALRPSEHRHLFRVMTGESVVRDGEPPRDASS